MTCVTPARPTGTTHIDAWLARFVFPHANSHLAFQEHLHSIDDRLAQCERLERLLREAAIEWRFYPVIQALQTMRGIQFTVAVGLLAEIGEFSRFDTPRQLMAWPGLVPSEYSSGLSMDAYELMTLPFLQLESSADLDAQNGAIDISKKRQEVHVPFHSSRALTSALRRVRFARRLQRVVGHC